MATSATAPIHTTLVSVFDDPTHARAALEDLRRSGVSDDQIGFAAPGARPAVQGATDAAEVEDGDWYESELQAGRTIVMVRNADERAEEIRELLRGHGGSIREPSPVGTYGTGLPATPF
jgi:hypothetical protein